MNGLLEHSELVMALRVSACAAALAVLATLVSAAEQASPFVVDVQVNERPEISCRYLPDVTILAPAAWRIRLTVLNGATSLSLPDQWYRSGGMVIDRAHPVYTLFTPALEGRYEVVLAGPEADKTAVLALQSILPVEPDGRGRLLISGRWETYPDPLKSRTKRVRENAAFFKAPLLVPLFDACRDWELAPGLAAGAFLPLNDLGRRSANAVALSPAITNKLAMARMFLAQSGLKPDALRIVSAFRPPSYNRRVGGEGYSRHIYGDAVDTVYDANGDGKMDDVNRDGRVDRQDGFVLADMYRKAEAAGAVPGGIGVYEYSDPDSRLAHVHVDARGYVTRWGMTYRTRKPSAFKWWPPEEFDEDEDDE